MNDHHILQLNNAKALFETAIADIGAHTPSKKNKAKHDEFAVRLRAIHQDLAQIVSEASEESEGPLPPNQNTAMEMSRALTAVFTGHGDGAIDEGVRTANGTQASAN